jgi:hypothetical protein
VPVVDHGGQQRVLHHVFGHELAHQLGAGDGGVRDAVGVQDQQRGQVPLGQ